MKVLTFAVIGAGLLLAVVWLGQRRMIYLPTGDEVPSPDAVLTGAEAVRFATSDGLELNAWFVRSANRPSRGTFVVFHGNAGSRADRAPLATAFRRRGFSVLLTDYRGYGGNPGSPDEQGLARDARAALAYARSRKDVDPDRLIVFGESLGAAVALELATEERPALLVLRSPFTSLVDVGRLHYPLLPVRWLLLDRYPSLERVGDLACPLIVVAGEQDRIVPIEQSRRLFEAAPAEDRRWLGLKGTGHNDRTMLDGDAMLDAIERYWDDLYGTNGRVVRTPDQEAR